MIRALQTADECGGRRGREAHRVYVANVGLDCRGEPIAKLFNRVAGKIAPAQAFTDMLIT